jgi:elongation factor Ts
MANISAADVKALRDKTNAPMMECKSALTAAGGDMEKAIDLLRAKMKDISVKRGDRETAEGRIAAYVTPDLKVGALVEMRCESPPVAKAEHFITLANQVARQIAETNPKDVDALLAAKLFDKSGQTVQERVNDVIGLIRENMKPARFVRYEGLVGEYIHHDGTNGVLLQVEGAKADPALLRDVCMHIAARSPMAARKEDVPADVVAKEQEIAKEQIANDPKNKSKPANILQMIIEGKLKTWYAENVLVEQPFVKDDTKTVGQLLAQHGLKMVRFARYRVGEVS